MADSHNIKSYLKTLDAAGRLDLAISMASELKDTHEQFQSLALAIMERLAPPAENEAALDWQAYRLSQVLCDAMCDMGPLLRIEQCIASVRKTL